MSPRESDRLEQYLDGLLAPAERAEFEREMVASPALREQAELQARINAGLQRLMAPGPLKVETPPVVGRLWLTPRRFALAAGLSIVAVGVWWAVLRGPTGPDPLEAEYRQVVASGFTPQTVCTDDATFRAWVHNKFGEPLQPKPDRGPVQYVGWSVSRVLSSYSGLLLARVEGHEVVVMIDRKQTEDGRLPQPADPALHQYRRVLGGLVLYEITPLDRPAVINSLMKP